VRRRHGAISSSRIEECDDGYDHDDEHGDGRWRWDIRLVVGAERSLVSAFLSLFFEKPSIDDSRLPRAGVLGGADMGGGAGAGGGGGPLLMVSSCSYARVAVLLVCEGFADQRRRR